MVQSNATNEISFTLSEIRGKMPLTGVRLRCTDLASPVETLKGSTVKFDLNSFDVPAGGQQVVHATIPVSKFFYGKAKGSLIVETADGVTATIPLNCPNGREEIILCPNRAVPTRAM